MWHAASKDPRQLSRGFIMICWSKFLPEFRRKKERNVYEGVTVSQFLVICPATLFQMLLLAPVFLLFCVKYLSNWREPDDNRAETYRSWKVTRIQLYPTIRQLYTIRNLKIKVPGNQPTSAWSRSLHHFPSHQMYTEQKMKIRTYYC